MGVEVLIMLVILVGGLFLMNSLSRRSQKKRLDEREEMFNNQLVPGVWVQTLSGFFGRFVDIDGDVVILETPSGEETYWVKAAVRGVMDPPFEALSDSSSDDASDVGEITAAEEETVETVSGDTEVDFDAFEAQFRAPADGEEEGTQSDDEPASSTQDEADAVDKAE
mgnify:CR=1 FL=1